MNRKELNEIRRRMAPDKSGIGRIYGCYVNSNREIISYIDESFGLMPALEAEKYMDLFQKTLSGRLGRNLIDIVFSTKQVQDSEEHRLLMGLRDSKLNNREIREQFYQKVIRSVGMKDTNYLLLLACDTYDVPYRGKDDEPQADASDTVFTYIICTLCPVKDGRPELGYFSGENEFHGYAAKQIVAAPELGFMFPAFDDRSANIYKALFYSKDASQLHQEFIDAVFNVEAPMSAGEQQEAFRSVLADALENDCSFDIVQTIHEQFLERIEQHKESNDPEPPDIPVNEVARILQDCGISENRVQMFREKCKETFGDGAVLNPGNIIESRKFELTTPQVRIAVDPEYSYMVETRIIDGKRYILIPADEGVAVNGIDVKITNT